MERSCVLSITARRAAVATLATLLGCGGNSGLKNGQQQCAPVGTSPRCPPGYTCQFDNHCWQDGTGPVTDGSVTDARSTDGANPIPSDGTIFASPDSAFSLDTAFGDALSAADVPIGKDAPPNPLDLGAAPDAPVTGDVAAPRDLAPPPDAAAPPPPVPAPAGRRMVPAGTVSRSTHHVAFRTLAQVPGSQVMQSAHYRAARGIVGATQPQ